jgi:hypothetical protein
MKRFQVDWLLNSLHVFDTWENYWTLGGKGVKAQFDEKVLQGIEDHVETCRTVLERMMLVDSCAKISKSLQYFKSHRSLIDASSVGTELRTIRESILNEIEKNNFVQVLAGRKDYFEQAMLFGEELHSSFPSARNDIREAGNCFAVDCNTAAVFHLMRSVECGLRAFCYHFGFKQVRKKHKKTGRIEYVPIEYSQWELMLNQLGSRAKAKIDKLKSAPKKQLHQEFYYPLIQDLAGFKDAFRNHVMHSRREYSGDEAKAIFDRVNRFMSVLASRVSEV